MIALLIAFHMQFLQSPVNLKTADGFYLQVVRTDYDATTNTTYDTVATYSAFQGNTSRVYWMESVPFAGPPSQDDMLKSIKDYQKLAGSNVQVVK